MKSFALLINTRLNTRTDVFSTLLSFLLHLAAVRVHRVPFVRAHVLALRTSRELLPRDVDRAVKKERRVLGVVKKHGSASLRSSRFGIDDPHLAAWTTWTLLFAQCHLFGIAAAILSLTECLHHLRVPCDDPDATRQNARWRANEETELRELSTRLHRRLKAPPELPRTRHRRVLRAYWLRAALACFPGHLTVFARVKSAASF